MERRKFPSDSDILAPLLGNKGVKENDTLIDSGDPVTPDEFCSITGPIPYTPFPEEIEEQLWASLNDPSIPVVVDGKKYYISVEPTEDDDSCARIWDGT